MKNVQIRLGGQLGPPPPLFGPLGLRQVVILYPLSTPLPAAPGTPIPKPPTQNGNSMEYTNFLQQVCGNRVMWRSLWTNQR